MFQSFIEWLSDQIDERGLGSAIATMATIVGLAGALSALFGNFPLRAAALVVVALAALSVAIFLVSDRRLARRELRTVSRLLQRYCDVIHARTDMTLQISEWSQTVEINEHGDAVVHRELNVTPTGRELHFLYLNLSYYGESPQHENVRRRVKAEAQQISVDGAEGARFVITASWTSDTEHQILVHFNDPIPVGNAVAVGVRWEWPRYSQGLMHGGIEDFDVRFSDPVDAATYEIVLSKRSRRDKFVSSVIGPVSRYERYERDDDDLTYRMKFTVKRPTPHLRYGVRVDKRN